MILKNDYMSCKDYNLMKSLSKCLCTYEFSSNEFCAILICFIGHKVSRNEWIVQCVQGVKILNVLYLMKNCGWPYIDDNEGMVSLKVWICVLF
jgi:hypothetical protein